ncbi:MAG: hypothetical protein DRH20_03660 [Deltaproteobacteria bacterium]|nr:MAG: hypothetical protein DRH20_03660 [Deltaproteobacteria bacterium]
MKSGLVSKPRQGDDPGYLVPREVRIDLLDTRVIGCWKSVRNRERGDRRRFVVSKEIRWVKTHCARMDHGGCGLLVGAEGNRIVEIRADPEGYLNRGFVCAKGRHSHERLTHPGRLRKPLRRKGERGQGLWETVSWDEALGEIRDRLASVRDRYGARAVAFCQGMPKGLEHFVLIRLANLFGSPNVVAVQDVCHAPREVTGLHTVGFYPVADLHHPSRLVILWGSNPSHTNEEGVISSLLQQQLREGTELLVVDPIETALARKARAWLPIRPGTDAALAAGFLHVIINENLYDRDFVARWTRGFDALARQVQSCSPERVSEITWVPAEAIREAARAYAAARPAAVLWGNPIEQTPENFDAARALVCLMALCGNLDVPGGNIHAVEPPVAGLGKFVRADMIPEKRKEMIHAHHGTIPRLMTVPPAHFREAVLADTPYPVRAAYMQCTNPLVTYADSPRTLETLKRLEFLAVSEVFMTPTAAMADVVLPAATHFEFNDIGHYGLGHGIVLARPKVVDPPPLCRPDIWILNELGKALTPTDLWFDDYEALLDLVLEPSGLDFEAFARKGFLKGPDRFRKYETSGFKTPSGKVELFLEKAEAWGLSPLPGCEWEAEGEDARYPLVLTSAKSRYYLHSSYRWVEGLRTKEPDPIAQIHPETAAGLGIGDGDDVVIETESGSILQKARLNSRMHPRVVCASSGWWFPESGPPFDWDRSNYNMLTCVDRTGKAFGTPRLRGIGCRISRRRDPDGSPGA